MGISTFYFKFQYWPDQWLYSYFKLLLSISLTFDTILIIWCVQRVSAETQLNASERNVAGKGGVPLILPIPATFPSEAFNWVSADTL